jgi:hypothetical protein
VIDRDRFDDFAGFAREFSRLLDDYEWRGNLDAFNDILRGGFGTPDQPWTFLWLNSARSQRVLGHEAAAQRFEGLLTTAHPSNHARIRRELERARSGQGQTVFELIVEIIRSHGPAGDEAEDGVILDLA